MKENGKRNLTIGICMLACFALWTLLLQCVDVQSVGPLASSVGFAFFNVWFHRLTGVHMIAYAITDWLGLVPIIVCLCFGVIGLMQWIRRRSIKRVDRDLILLGVYYIVVLAGYLIFEKIPINYRPVLIEGGLETSYPSSTTLLVLSVMPILKYQTDRRTDDAFIRKITAAFVRVFRGVH